MEDFDRRILGTAVVWWAYPRRRMQSAMPGIAAPSGLVIFGIRNNHRMPLPGAASKHFLPFLNGLISMIVTAEKRIMFV